MYTMIASLIRTTENGHPVVRPDVIVAGDFDMAFACRADLYHERNDDLLVELRPIQSMSANEADLIGEFAVLCLLQHPIARAFKAEEKATARVTRYQFSSLLESLMSGPEEDYR